MLIVKVQKKYKDPAAVITLYKECMAYNKSLKYKPVEGYYDGEYKQGELLDLSVFPEEVRNQVDDNWGEPIDFTVEEILDMPVMGDEIGEPKVSAYKEQNPNYSDIADSESQSEKVRREPFGVTGKDSDYIDIDNLY